jgi:F0F1-type ATP synthase assembly protein I
MPSDPAPPMRNWAAMAQAGTALTGPVLLGIILDLTLNWSPWGTLAGILLGLVACVAQLIQLSKRNLDADRPEKPNPPT